MRPRFAESGAAAGPDKGAATVRGNIHHSVSAAGGDHGAFLTGYVAG